MYGPQQAILSKSEFERRQLELKIKRSSTTQEGDVSVILRTISSSGKICYFVNSSAIKFGSKQFYERILSVM